MILFIYLALVVVISFGLVNLANVLIREVRVLTEAPKNIFNLELISLLPSYEIAGQKISLQPMVEESINALSLTASELQKNLIPFFTGALHTFVSVIIFLVSAFYFLRDGQKMIFSLKERLPLNREKASELVNKINRSLSDYLRGLVVLILIMSVATWVALSVLGVKFALLLGIMTGFLEIIPLLGPITATLIAVIISTLTGNNNFGLDPISLGVVVVIIYFTLRQFEDYFIIPQVLGHTTKLHPLIILFSVLVGGKLAGPLGFVLAVPVAATVRILLEYMEGLSSKKGN